MKYVIVGKNMEVTESLKDAVQSFKAQFAQMLSAAKDALDATDDM